MVRRGLVVLAVALGAVVVPAGPAAACSCATGDPRWALAQVDAAFVGRALGPPTVSAGGGATWRFEVDEAVKGDIGATVEVTEPFPGDCSINAPTGTPTGVLLRGSPGAWTSNLCWQLDPDVLLRAGGPLPTPDGTGPPAFMVAGQVDGQHALLLDSAGRTLAGAGGDGLPGGLAPCPGGDVAVEVVAVGAGFEPAYTLVRWDVAGLTRLGEVDLGPGRAAALHCRSADGGDVLVHLADGPETPGRVVRVTPGGVAEVAVTPGGSSSFGADGGLLYVAGRDELSAVDLATGVVSSLGRVDLPGVGLGRPAASPDGRLVAAFQYGYDGAGSPPSRVVLFDRSASPPTVVTDDLAESNASGHLLWADDGTLVYSPGGGDDDEARVYDRGLRLLGSFDGWWASSATVVDGVLVGGGWGTLLAAPLPSGPVSELRRWDGASPLTLVALPGADVTLPPGAEGPGGAGGPGTAAARPDGGVEQGGAGADRPAGTFPLAVGAVLLAGAAAAVGWAVVQARRRRRRRVVGWGSTAPAADLAPR